jgi:8-hydroxy-5-deazaflavin:NADPH oxidoreductase
VTAIAVLGAGNVGAALARKWTAAGQQVTLASRHPDAAALRDLAVGMHAGTATHADAVREAAVVLVALPGAAVAAVVAALGRALDGKIVIDATNDVAAAELNSVATVVEHAPDAVCARAFNSLGWENVADPDFGGTRADLLWCGPDGDPGVLVERLIADVACARSGSAASTSCPSWTCSPVSGSRSCPAAAGIWPSRSSPADPCPRTHPHSAMELLGLALDTRG